MNKFDDLILAVNCVDSSSGSVFEAPACVLVKLTEKLMSHLDAMLDLCQVSGMSAVESDCNDTSWLDVDEELHWHEGSEDVFYVTVKVHCGGTFKFLASYETVSSSTPIETDPMGIAFLKSMREAYSGYNDSVKLIDFNGQPTLIYSSTENGMEKIEVEIAKDWS
jgi:hypothetical protein